MLPIFILRSVLILSLLPKYRTRTGAGARRLRKRLPRLRILPTTGYSIITEEMAPAIPTWYRLFFLYIEPLSALAGAYYAAFRPADYLADLTLGALSRTPPTPAPTQTNMALLQLANLYFLFALNEHFVLSSTNSLVTWRRLLVGLLIADFGHLVTMAPAGSGIFWRVWEWNAMAWGSVGFVYAGAATRMCFLAGVGL